MAYNDVDTILTLIASTLLLQSLQCQKGVVYISLITLSGISC